MNTSKTRWLTVTGAIVSGLAASACCVLPLVLVWLGVSGAWMSNLTALSPYHIWFVTASVVMLATSGYLIFYKSRDKCMNEKTCNTYKPKKWVVALFWVAFCLIVIAVTFPYLLNFLHGE